MAGIVPVSTIRLKPNSDRRYEILPVNQHNTFPRTSTQRCAKPHLFFTTASLCWNAFYKLSARCACIIQLCTSWRNRWRPKTSGINPDLMSQQKSNRPTAPILYQSSPSHLRNSIFSACSFSARILRSLWFSCLSLARSTNLSPIGAGFSSLRITDPTTRFQL